MASENADQPTRTHGSERQACTFCGGNISPCMAEARVPAGKVVLCEDCATGRQLGGLITDALMNFCEIMEWGSPKVEELLSSLELSIRRKMVVRAVDMWRGAEHEKADLQERVEELTPRPEPQDTAVRESISKSMRYDVMRHDNFHCQLCGATAKERRLEIDHIHPVSKGGQTTMANLQTLCDECNSGKRDKVG